MTSPLYLYGFVPSSTPPPPTGVTGIENRAVELVEVDGFAAAVSLLPDAGYGDDELREGVTKLDWVAERGLAHERVVTWFVDHAGILPARLFTLYSSRDALLEETRRESSRLRGLVSRFAPLREWNLKILFDASSLSAELGAESAEIRELDLRIEAATPGRRYLLERKRTDLAEGILDATAARMAHDFLATVSRGALEVVQLTVPREEGAVRVALNAALLTAAEAGDALRARVDEGAEELRARGLSIEFSGPWAPYRFVTDRADDPADGPARGAGL